MSKLHGYSVKGVNRIYTIMIICVISYFIYYGLNKIFNIVILNNKAIDIPITFTLVFGSVFILFNKFIWRCPILKYFIKIPNISGKWKCNGESYKKSSSDLQSSGIINIVPQYRWNANITIIQTWAQICVILTTEKSESHSFMAQLELIGDEYYQLIYAFSNETKSGADSDMRNHDGLCKIDFKEKLSVVEGEYFANPKDRLSYGKMRWTK